MTDQIAPDLFQRLLRLLRWRIWLQEKLQPTDWQVTLWWAALAGSLGAFSSLGFKALSEGVHELLTGSTAGVVESMSLLPWWVVLLIPAFGGLACGLILLMGKRLAPGQSSTDYMEALAIGSGQIPLRASLVKSAAALFVIGSGGSIGREGPMVQLSAVAASLVSRWRRFSPPKQRLLVACGASAGIASAYNAPIAGSFFVAEIILGTIAMETLGPLAVAAVAAALTIRLLSDSAQLYRVPSFQPISPLEILPFVVLGLVAGTVAPWFLRSLRRAERLFVATTLPRTLRLMLGGLGVGGIAVFVPEVCGNGYSVVVDIVNGHLAWAVLVVVFGCKWLATACSFGSGAPGGVFTPSLFMGASTGFLFGTGLHSVWPAGAVDPRAFALVGMGAFLSAATHAPVMAIIMLFEMTLSYDIILPLMLCCVVAYYTSKGLESASLYSEALRKKTAEQSRNADFAARRVIDLMKVNPPTISIDARFAEIARTLLAVRVNNLYAVDSLGRYAGVVSLHDIKPYLSEPEFADLVIVRDVLREDFPRLTPQQTLTEALEQFLRANAERLPVIAKDGALAGSLAKGDLLLALVEHRTRPVLNWVPTANPNAVSL